ncbi:MAG TPA: CHASE domain-containing protein [Gemmatimonadaceae bacterium]|nr:CHASE domain-containing protein [Gemmatimonadaceae bacterium]
MRPRLSTPFVVLATSLVLTAGATTVVEVTAAARSHARFEAAVRSTQDRIRSRLSTYIAMLQGASGLFAASDTVTRREFKAYVGQLDLQQRYPGVQGIGYSERVAASSRDSLVGIMRRTGTPEFHVWPSFERPEYHAILYLEPLDRRNVVALGYDMFTEPTRRAAMERARDTGLPAMSGRVTLVQEIMGEKQPGFLIYLPVYTGDSTPSTVEARRQLLRGFVYSPFRAGDLFRAVIASEPTPPLAFRVYDGTEPTAPHLLYAYSPSPDVDSLDAPAITHSNIGGRTWTIAFWTVPGTGRGWLLPGAVAFAGILMSLSLFIAARAEAQARLAAQRSEAIRSRFFAAMSHELRTPLNAIIGYNDLLLLGVYGALADAQRVGITRSQRAAKHLAELVNDVLDLSKIEAGKILLDIEPVNVAVLVEELSATIGPMAEARGCDLQLECATDLPTVRTDPRRTRQIVLNLLSNATKFGGGRPVRIRCSPLDGGVMVEVEDHGPGIAPDNIARIFEEFAQLPDVAHGGTGLGLAISRRLARLLGGRLEAESTVGHGSTFRLVLPAEAPTDGAAR